MQTSNSLPVPPSRTPRHKLSRDTVSLIGDLLPTFDFGAVLLAAYLATMILTTWLAPGFASAPLLDGIGQIAVAGAILAPFVLCDRAFVSFASSGQAAEMIRCYVVRFLIFAGMVAVIATASRGLITLPALWFAFWCLMILVITTLVRLVLVGSLRHLEHDGVLSEAVAIVGAGAKADMLIGQLRCRTEGRVRIVGVFDDSCDQGQTSVLGPVGSITDLLELGKSQPMDWILLTQPDADPDTSRSIVRRLKALSTPIALWSSDDNSSAGKPVFGRATPSISPHIERVDGGWHSTRHALADMVPRWIETLLLDLPRAAYRALRATFNNRTRAVPTPKKADVTLTLDDYDLATFTEAAAGFGQARYGYVVTPNADHLDRLHRDVSFRTVYADAAYTVLDSRLMSHWLRLTRGLRLPVCTGSDLTAELFAKAIDSDDAIVLIGGSDRQAAQLTERYGLTGLSHFNPPMGFIHDPSALEACLRYVEAHSPFRYCLLAVGAPQQEQVAQSLRTRGVARGLALCIGASINFLTGDERRAPRWMQRMGMEWLFRLLQAPRRMTERYLLRGPRLFGLLRRTEIVLRPAVVASDAAMAEGSTISCLDTGVPPAYPDGPAGYAIRHRLMASRGRQRNSLPLVSRSR